MKFKYDKETEKLILTQSTRIEHHQLQLWLTRFVKGYKFSQPYKMKIWNGKESYFENGKVNLGLWKECMLACKEIDVPFIIENKEDFPINRDVSFEDFNQFCKDFFKDHKIKKGNDWIPFIPYDYQIQSAFKILRNRYCITEIATSGGKSLVISLVFFYILKNVKPDAKLLIIVPNISLVNQFYDNIIDFNIGENVEYDGGNKNPLPLKIDEIMSERPRKHSKTEDANIYIGTYQSLEKWDKKFFKQFYGVVVDESHKAKASTIKKLLKQTFGTAYLRFGVSGTFPNDDSCEILTIQSVLGPKVTQIEASTLVENGNITPMEITALVLNHNQVQLYKRLKSARNLSNGGEIYNIEKKLVQESQKRIDFIKRLVEKKCNNNTIVLFHTIEYGQKIFETLKEIDGIDVYYIDGTISAKNRKHIIEEMNKTDRIKILVSSYGTTATGLSINSIFNVIFADSFKSESLIIQAIGRALRLFKGKDKATIYDIVDVLDANDMTNTLYRQFTERERFYKKRKYPYKILKFNL